jgi:hypothetical protein
MANFTAEQIEQKKQQLKQLAEEVKTLKDELVEAGAWPMDDDDLDQATGGTDPLRHESVNNINIKMPKPGFDRIDHENDHG